MDYVRNKRFALAVRMDLWLSGDIFSQLLTSSGMKMIVSEQTQREIVLQIHSENEGSSKSFIVKLCMLAGIKRSTAYAILLRIETGQPIQRKPGSGPKSANLTPKVKQALKRRTAGKVAVSFRRLGRD